MNRSIIPYSPKNGMPGCMVGIEFYLESEKLLKELIFYITEYGKPDDAFGVSIYKFSSSGSPDIRIHETSGSFQSLSDAGNNWSPADLKNEKIHLKPGKYLFAMKWTVVPEKDGLNTHTIGFREDERIEQHSWMNWTGSDSGWSKDTGPYKGNFMIKAVFQ